MRLTSATLRILAKLFCTYLFLFAANSAHSDGISESGENNVVSGVEAASIEFPIKSKPFCRPSVNHPAINLSDGRILVAGGMASAINQSDRTFDSNSELWDPATGGWQVLGEELKFEPDQKVFLNQISDDRILFFATREKGEHGLPEYQARIWNPATSLTEILKVGVKAKINSDIVVMNDGRVLIINGIDASADVWDSRSGIIQHNEVPELENLRWTGLQLKNQQLLLIATFPDGELASRKSIDDSTVLLWDIKSDTWKVLPSIPKPFRESYSVAELENGTLYADGYHLTLPRKNWEFKGYPNVDTDSLECIGNTPKLFNAPLTASSVISTTSSSIPSQQSSPSVVSSWWLAYSEEAGEYRWVFLAILIPAALYLLLRLIDEHKMARFLNFAGSFSRRTRMAFPTLVIVFSIWILLYPYNNTMMVAAVGSCMEHPFPIRGKATALHIAQSEVECLDKELGWMNKLSFNSTKSRIMSLKTPCQYIGIWSAKRPGGNFKITLTDNNEYAVEQQEGYWGGRSVRSSWGVFNDEMIWVYSSFFPELPQFDINHIQNIDRGHFNLVDVDGVQTTFELIDAIKSNACSL